MSLEYALSLEATSYNRNTLKYGFKKEHKGRNACVCSVQLSSFAEYGAGEEKGLHSFSLPILSTCPLLQESPQA